MCRRRCGSGTLPAGGQIVRTSLLAAVVGAHAFQGTRWTVAGEVGRAQGTLPGSTLRTFTVDDTGAETESTRIGDILPPPQLEADADAIRRWLDQPLHSGSTPA